MEITNNLELPEPIRIKSIHRKIDIFSENSEIKRWTGNILIDSLFYLYLFNKYKHNCLLKYKGSTSNGGIGLELIIKEIPIAKQNIAKNHVIEIAKQLSNCIKKGLSSIIIPLYLRTKFGGHANLLIYRKQNHVIEHFEPTGSGFFENEPILKKLINTKLDEFISILNKDLPIELHVKIVRANDVCPFFDGLQNLETKAGKKLEIQGPGYCAAWSMFFTELALKNPTISSNELIKIIYDKLDKMPQETRSNYMRKIILGYVNLIHDKITKYFSIIFGKNTNVTELMETFKERKDLNVIFDVITIVDIQLILLNNPSLTKEQYLQSIKQKITNTSDADEKNRLIIQEKLLQKIDILLNVSPISEEIKVSSQKSKSNSNANSSSSKNITKKKRSITKSKSASSNKSSSSISSIKLSSPTPKSKSSSSNKSLSSIKLSSPIQKTKSSSSNKSRSSISSIKLSSPIQKTKSSSSNKSRSSISSIKLSSPIQKTKSSSSNKNLSSIKLSSPTPKSKSSSSNKSSSSISSIKLSSPIQKSKSSSLKKSSNLLENSVDSIQKSVASLENSIKSLKEGSNLSPKKSSSSLKKSINSFKNSVSSLKSSVNTIEDVQFSISLSSKTKSKSTSSKNDAQKSRSNEEKYENLRCKNKKLKPCSENQVRNPITCRCNKIKVNNTRSKRKICEPEKMKSCLENKVRNPITCRCRKIKVGKTGCENKKLKPCSENQVRNPITCRCNKK
jgi:exonuclease VII small subunit